jgi:hypothetical protein
MSIIAAAAIAVSRRWFCAQTSPLLNAHTVVTNGLNVCFPLLPAPPLLEGQAVMRQYRDVVAPVSLEPHNLGGGAAFYLRASSLDPL